ncbi:hypothetical protein NIES3585_26830 [Nodularia sp. NIES-3585]|nr:hypothetical protein NIES3585_26830 [Nodularia sp. NIES-3585]
MVLLFTLTCSQDFLQAAVQLEAALYDLVKVLLAEVVRG